MKKVAILFGGKSPEHEVSIMSAKNVYAEVDSNLFESHLIYQNTDGDFLKVENFENLIGEKLELKDFKYFDRVFPVMHGPNCEDGKIQGFLETIGVKYVGPKVLSSAICMDKDFQKQIAKFNKIKVADWVSIKKYQNLEEKNIEIEKLGFPLFVKPSNMGSSVGITKVHNNSELESACNQAFKYDEKILIEKGVLGREIEIAILGAGDNIIISNPGEVIATGNHEFYNYNAKYLDENGSRVIVPALSISQDKITELKLIAKKIYNLFECSGLSRIDFFLEDDGNVIFNEVNTLPGFTNISMYPKLMEESGINYKDLITRLINTA